MSMPMALLWMKLFCTVTVPPLIRMPVTADEPIVLPVMATVPPLTLMPAPEKLEIRRPEIDTFVAVELTVIPTLAGTALSDTTALRLRLQVHTANNVQRPE